MIDNKQYQNQVILGETGWPVLTSGCTYGIDINSQAQLYADIATNSTLLQSTSMMLLWRTMQLSTTNPVLACEASFGVTSSDDTVYSQTGVSMFTALGGSGQSTSCAV